MKVLMGLMALRVMAASLAQSRLGPKTTARLVLVILFWSQWADICGRKGATARTYGSPPPTPSNHIQSTQAVAASPPPSPGGQWRPRDSHLHQEGSQEVKHLVVLLWQSLENLLCHLHSLAFINICEEWKSR